MSDNSHITKCVVNRPLRGCGKINPYSNDSRDKCYMVDLNKAIYNGLSRFVVFTDTETKDVEHNKVRVRWTPNMNKE